MDETMEKLKTMSVEKKKPDLSKSKKQEEELAALAAEEAEKEDLRRVIGCSSPPLLREE